MKKKTSVALSEETLLLADSIAEADDRSRSYVIDKATTIGLERMDSPKAKSIRAKKAKK